MDDGNAFFWFGYGIPSSSFTISLYTCTPRLFRVGYISHHVSIIIFRNFLFIDATEETCTLQGITIYPIYFMCLKC